MTALPAAAKAPDGADSDSGGQLAYAPIASVAGTLDNSDQGLAAAGRMALAGETREALDAAAGSTHRAGSESASQSAADALAAPGAASASALPQGTEIPFEALAHALVADGVAMPSAEQLQALAGTPEAPEQSQLVSKVLVDALAGGEGGGAIDALIDAVAGQAATPALAQVAAAADIGDGPFAAAASFHAGFALAAFGHSGEPLTAYPDAIAQA
jgi:hypothetical protein